MYTVFHWLCFEITIEVFVLSEVGKIFPSGFDYRTKTDDENERLLNELENTGYWS
jgi:hypothetical protein